MANLGSLGIGGALANALNTGLDLGNKFSDYQKNRYLESSDQINKLSSNQADIWGNHNREMMNASMSPEIANLFQTAPRTEVQAAQTLQGQLVQGNAEQNAVNDAVIQNVLNNNVYGGGTQTLPQDAYLLGQTQQLNDYQQPLTPEQMGARFREQLQLNGGNPETSLRGVINGY